MKHDKKINLRIKRCYGNWYKSNANFFVVVRLKTLIMMKQHA